MATRTVKRSRIWAARANSSVRNTLAAALPEPFALLNGLTLPRCAPAISTRRRQVRRIIRPQTQTMAASSSATGRHVATHQDWSCAGTAYGEVHWRSSATSPAKRCRRARGAKRRLPHPVLGHPLWVEGLVVFAHPGTPARDAEQPRSGELLSGGHQRLEVRTNEPRRACKRQDVPRRDRGAAAGAKDQHAAAPPAQALVVETALVLLRVPLALVFGSSRSVACFRRTPPSSPVAHEVAARERARFEPRRCTAPNAAPCRRSGARTGRPTAGCSRLLPDVSAFRLAEGRVMARAHYRLDLADLPLLGWAPPLGCAWSTG